MPDTSHKPLPEQTTAPAPADNGAAPGLLPTLIDTVPTALVWRYLCHSLMLGLAMLNEMRAAPTLPDTVLDLVPYTQWIDHHNYGLWLAAYVPIALLLWRADRSRFVHFLYVGGIVSLVRGLSIGMTGLGPVHGVDVNAGMSLAEAASAWWALINPVGALMGEAPHVYLTKDLFFSGHTATTFLLVLYTWNMKRLRWIAVAGHVFVVSTVFLAHLHYTIDVIGAWAITACIYLVAQRVVSVERFRRGRGSRGGA